MGLYLVLLEDRSCDQKWLLKFRCSVKSDNVIY